MAERGASAPLLCVGGGEDPAALVVDADSGQLLWYGDWPDAGGAIAAAPMPRARWGARLDDPPRPTPIPGAGAGHDGAPALEFLRDDGRWSFAATRVEVVRTDDGGVEVRQEDAAAGVRVTTHLSVDAPSGALCASSSLDNLGADPLELRWLAALALPLPHWVRAATDLVGDWCAEFRRVRVSLDEASWLRETREGRSSHRRPAAVLLDDDRCGDRQGRSLGLQLAWSGDHRWRVDRLADGSRVLQAGVLLQPGEVRLEAGARYVTPALWCLFSGRGRDGLAARMHDVCRRRVLPDRGMRRPRPVHLNTWEAVYFDHEPGALGALADRAAALGVERFVLDDGWFLGRTDDARALGDWQVDPQRHPQGLGPLIDRVRGLGMGFGLWVEPEMVNDDSELARAHPDWIRGAAPPRAPDTGRHQRVLDLTQAPVVEHLFAVLDGLLADHAIEYLKWDHNRVLTGLAADGSAGHHAQTLALYGLVDRLRAAHPDVEIETCASGGGRADWGMLARTHRVWVSDCNDPVLRARIMAGVFPLLPPEVAGVHVGPATAHTTGRTTGLDFRAAVSLLGASGLELDVRDLDAPEAERLAAHIDRYRRWRDVLHGGRLGTPVDDGEHLVRIAFAEDRSRAILVVLRLDDREPGRPVRFALADADPERSYRVRLSEPAPDGAERPPALTSAGPWRGSGSLVSGAWLAGPGLALQLPAPQRAVVLELRAE